MSQEAHRYSHHALRAIAHAATLASGFQHDQQDTAHLLVGVMLAEGSIGAQVLQDLNLVAEVAGVYLKRLQPRLENVTAPTQAEALQISLQDAVVEADWLASHYIGTEHLLLGITRTNPGNATELLRLLDISSEQIRRRVRHLLQDRRESEFNLDTVRTNKRISELGRRVLNAAEQTAFSLEHPTVGIGHLLLALVKERRGVTSDILQRSGLDVFHLQIGLGKRDPLLLFSVESIINAAIEQADKLGSHYVGADHLLLTLSLLPAGVSALQRHGAEPDRVNRLLNKHLRGD
jgi:ATP-dependent Clp protease ATP-binding subunit ClpA